MSLIVVFACFFFYQKTAYEVRISDWSSDVCSSDLPRRVADGAARTRRGGADRRCGLAHAAAPRHPARDRADNAARVGADRRGDVPAVRRALCDDAGRSRAVDRHHPRSEEHTSELQSLMRISYAVFCLKKKRT